MNLEDLLKRTAVYEEVVVGDEVLIPVALVAEMRAVLQQLQETKALADTAIAIGDEYQQQRDYARECLKAAEQQLRQKDVQIEYLTDHLAEHVVDHAGLVAILDEQPLPPPPHNVEEG